MEIRDYFIQQFGQNDNIQVVTAPGRVNVIGEHTDYNDGFVFPVAIDKYVHMAGSLRDDRVIKVYSVDLEDSAEFRMDEIKPDGKHSWANYSAGVVKQILDMGYDLKGMNLAFTGNIPMGAGLSSSAALEIATAYLVKGLHQIEIKPIDVVRLCQRTENEFVGVNCGIMDQYISCLGQESHALLIDCRSLDAQPVSILNSEVKLIIANTNVKHSLVDSVYNQRRQQCEDVVQLLSELTGKTKIALRDVTVEEFERYSQQIPQDLRQRAEHVVFENQRVIDGLKVLNQGDLVTFGNLMDQSHQSLRDLYQVSCSELDLMVELAKQVDGVYGSRMTGGGFGGCTVTLIQADRVDEFIAYVGQKYEAETGIMPDFYVCNAVDGAEAANL